MKRVQNYILLQNCFLRANGLWQHSIVNDIALLNASTFTAYDVTSML